MAQPRHAARTNNVPATVEAPAPALEADQRRAGEDEQRPEPGPAAEVLVEHHDPHDERERTLEVQQQ